MNDKPGPSCTIGNGDSQLERGGAGRQRESCSELVARREPDLDEATNGSMRREPLVRGARFATSAQPAQVTKADVR